MKYLVCFFLFLICSVTSAQGERSDLKITYVKNYGYYMNIYDLSSDMKRFMGKRNLHGGGPTWIVLLETALKLESPATLRFVELDDEASVVQVRSKNKKSIVKVRQIAKRLMTDRKYLIKYINIAKKSGNLE